MTAKITFKEDTAAATPASGYVALYAKADGKMYFKDDLGTEYPVEGTAGATGAAGPSGKDFSGELSLSVAGSALTIAVKDSAGADPTALSPVTVKFRSPTATSGAYDELSLTAATSLVISSGSTLGSTNGVAFRGWIVGFNDAGTFRLGVINCISGTNIFPLGAWGIASSTAEGGAGAADSAQIFYTGTAVTSKAYTVIGYFTYETALGAAGTYASAPGRVQLFGPGVSLPGQVVQAQRTDTGAVVTGTTQIPLDDTIPQNTEGDQYQSQAITPSSAANILSVDSQTFVANSAAAYNQVTALFQDSVASALRTVVSVGENAARQIMHRLNYRALAASVSATTFKIRSGGGGVPGTTTLNGVTSTRQFGGTANSFIEVTEIMA